MSPAIAITHLTKKFGKTEAVSDLTLAVEHGSICGLLGANGAGKTSTFKCLLSFARPDAGEVRFDGAPLTPPLFERLSYVPERSAFAPWLRGRDYLELMRRTHRKYDEARVRELLALLALDPAARIRTLSKGQQTALALVLAFSIRPSLLILDEPTSGLDPIMQRHVLDLLIEAAANGATVLFSSHQITQVERAADRVAILKHGKLVVDDNVDNLKKGEKIVEAVFENEIPRNALATDVRVRRVEQSGRVLRAFVHSDSEGVAGTLNALRPRSLSILDLNLEDIFINAVADERVIGA